MYNIYKFQENQRTFLSSLTHSLTHSLHFTSLHFTSLHFTHFTSLTTSLAAWAFGSLGFRHARGGGRWRADMASGGESFGTERARLAGDGLRTERARLAQGGYRGRRLWHRTCKTSPGWLPGEKALAQNVQD